ncbi:MAG: pantoate--beta-alanine ligase [Candidatus Eremiobacteraeota bacterium]|nr:pantoate--beta-alanine ligase [Candidatus Eremiobacteraeota bacterium]
MKVERDVAGARAAGASLPRPLGFVPTMGALHAGHVALVSAARAECRAVAVSLYVNPLQFGAGEDFERYPRDFERDRAQFAAAGADLLFVPDTAMMLPVGYSTYVDVGPMADRFEGARRPGHFRGVATVVAKLLDIMRPDVLYLGQKDAQQTAVVRRMVRDLEIGVDVRIVPTVRDADGVALSSRNAYLSKDERHAAPSLHAMLQRVCDLMENGIDKGSAISQAGRMLSPPGTLEYLDVVDADSFEPIETLRPPAFIIAAARLGKTRLLDNLWIH